eukprot:NODE_316_length_1905_cov_229.035022_g226_i0.p1 GENE.NODE_316_length_1905_cov_229.035022_g226_i0~~NODE_316_length_1905_cov_229.035022_g226_i0.p1  ORF type:complete len:562 (+),score=139.82 NODE_316_length_1905_cov_229.035022_g226_i0:51-1688(+)
MSTFPTAHPFTLVSTHGYTHNPYESLLDLKVGPPEPAPVPPNKVEVTVVRQTEPSPTPCVPSPNEDTGDIHIQAELCLSYDPTLTEEDTVAPTAAAAVHAAACAAACAARVAAAEIEEEYTALPELEFENWADEMDWEDEKMRKNESNAQYSPDSSPHVVQPSDAPTTEALLAAQCTTEEAEVHDNTNMYHAPMKSNLPTCPSVPQALIGQESTVCTLEEHIDQLVRMVEEFKLSKLAEPKVLGNRTASLWGLPPCPPIFNLCDPTEDMKVLHDGVECTVGPPPSEDEILLQPTNQNRQPYRVSSNTQLQQKAKLARVFEKIGKEDCGLFFAPHRNGDAVVAIASLWAMVGSQLEMQNLMLDLAQDLQFKHSHGETRHTCMCYKQCIKLVKKFIALEAKSETKKNFTPSADFLKEKLAKDIEDPSKNQLGCLPFVSAWSKLSKKKKKATPQEKNKPCVDLQTKGQRGNNRRWVAPQRQGFQQAHQGTHTPHHIYTDMAHTNLVTPMSHMLHMGGCPGPLYFNCNNFYTNPGIFGTYQCYTGSVHV